MPPQMPPPAMPPPGTVMPPPVPAMPASAAPPAPVAPPRMPVVPTPPSAVPVAPMAPPPVPGVPTPPAAAPVAPVTPMPVAPTATLSGTAAPAAPLAPAEPPKNLNAMNIIFVSSECAPWSKTGGLGDVAGALPQGLSKRDHRVMVVTPRYSDYAEAEDTGVLARFPLAGGEMEVRYFHGYINGVDYVFVDSPVFSNLGDNIYSGGREDVMMRNALLCRAAIEAPWLVPCGGVPYGDNRLMFLCNDWHTALLPVFLQECYREYGKLEYARSTMILHNMAYQGRGPMTDLNMFHLPEHCHVRFCLDDPVGGIHMNILMAGIRYSQRLVAVSPGYAWECKTQEGGWGLDEEMREAEWKLAGIVNGVNTEEWSPDVDPCLKSDGYTNYWLDDLKEGKAKNKLALQKELGLPERADVPLVGFIGRLDYQKGVDVIEETLPWMMGQDVQLIMLGSGREDLEAFLRRAEQDNSDRVRGWVGFSVKTAHRITAGCDMLLMPSRFEPCGLNQLYAMRYGTAPVVHAVGGLRDTVPPFNPFEDTGYGWTFDRCEASGLKEAMGNALETYRNHPDSFEKMQRRMMTQDMSWDNAAEMYEGVLVDALNQW